MANAPCRLSPLLSRPHLLMSLQIPTVLSPRTPVLVLSVFGFLLLTLVMTPTRKTYPHLRMVLLTSPRGRLVLLVLFEGQVPIVILLLLRELVSLVLAVLCTLVLTSFSALRRHASLSSLAASPRTPTTSLSHLSLATPPASPPSLLLPVNARARALLRPTCNSASSLSGRVQERTLIEKFVHSFINNPAAPDHSSLYISGSPGTGKTALVASVLRALGGQLSSNGIQVITVNCMALNNQDSLWSRLLEAFPTSHQTKLTKTGTGKESSEAMFKASLASQRTKWLVSSRFFLLPQLLMLFQHSISRRTGSHRAFISLLIYSFQDYSHLCLDYPAHWDRQYSYLDVGIQYYFFDSF